MKISCFSSTMILSSLCLVACFGLLTALDFVPDTNSYDNAEKCNAAAEKLVKKGEEITFKFGDKDDEKMTILATLPPAMRKPNSYKVTWDEEKKEWNAVVSPKVENNLVQGAYVFYLVDKTKGPNAIKCKRFPISYQSANDGKCEADNDCNTNNYCKDKKCAPFDGPKLGEECDEAKSKCSQRTSGAVCEEKKCACDKNSKLMAEKYGIAQKCVPDVDYSKDCFDSSQCKTDGGICGTKYKCICKDQEASLANNKCESLKGCKTDEKSKNKCDSFDNRKCDTKQDICICKDGYEEKDFKLCQKKSSANGLERMAFSSMTILALLSIFYSFSQDK